MRILHLIESMSLRYGGPVTVLESLAKEQAKSGHDVTIVTTNTEYPAGVLPVPVNQPVKISGVTTIYFDVQFRPLNISISMARHLSSIIADHDILDIHGLYRFPPTYAAWQARRRRRPYIIRPFGSLDPFLHARSTKSLGLKRIYETLFDLPNLRAASAICFNSIEERERTAYLGLTTPAFIAPNGLEWALYETLPKPGGFRARLGLPPETPLILFLGRINFKKGLDLLVPAFADVLRSKPGAKLAIVGPDNTGYGVEVRRLVKKHDLKDDVFFVDMLTGDAVREAFQDSDLFVLSSYTENFGMTVIESLACGTPVVISDQVNIFREVKASGGGIVTACDTGQISAAIIELLTDKNRLESMGALGRDWARANYSWQNIAKNLDMNYQEIIQNHCP